MPPPGAKERPDQESVDEPDRLSRNPARCGAGQRLRRAACRCVASTSANTPTPCATCMGLEVDVAALLPRRPAQGRLRQRRRASAGVAVLSRSIPLCRAQCGAAGRGQSEGRAGRAPPTATLADMVIALAAEGLPMARARSCIYKEGMPFGTRGGISFLHDFPAAGEYVLTIGDMASGRQMPRMEFEQHRDRAARWQGVLPHRQWVANRTRRPSTRRWNAVAEINARLRDIRFHAPAGQHRIAVTFLQAQQHRERGTLSRPTAARRRRSAPGIPAARCRCAAR